MRWIMIVLLIVLLAGMVSDRQRAHAQGDRPEVQFVATGVGRVTLEPDYAILVFSVETVGTTAQGAIRENAARMEALLKQLKGAIKPGDRIETAGFRLVAQRRGYTVVNQVQVRTRQMGELGSLIDLGARSGAHDVAIGGIGRENTKQAAQQAVREALQHARENAEAVAAGLGMRVGRITWIEPSVEQLEGPLAIGAHDAALRSSAAETPIQPGLLTLTARVQMRFVLLP